MVYKNKEYFLSFVGPFCVQPHHKNCKSNVGTAREASVLCKQSIATEPQPVSDTVSVFRIRFYMGDDHYNNKRITYAGRVAHHAHVVFLCSAFEQQFHCNIYLLFSCRH